MQYESFDLDVPNGGNGEGVPKEIHRHRIKSVYVTGTFNASVTVEIHPARTIPVDDTGWVPAGAAIVGGDAPKVLTFEHACRWIRVVVSSWVSGQPEVRFGGYDVV